MTETNLQWFQFFKLLALSVFCLLYGMGGISGKWKRRFFAPAIFGGALCYIAHLSNAFNWWMLTYIPLLSMALHAGYGADTTSKKILRRAIYGAGIVISMLPFAIITGMWPLFGFGAALIIATSIILGVFNITSSARSEETAIAAIAGFFVLWMF